MSLTGASTPTQGRRGSGKGASRKPQRTERRDSLGRFRPRCRRGVGKKRRELARRLRPLLRRACERTGRSHWHVSRVLGPGGWELAYLYGALGQTERQIAEQWGCAPSRIHVLLDRLRKRIWRAGYSAGPLRHRRPKTFVVPDPWELVYRALYSRQRSQRLRYMRFAERTGERR